MITVGLTGSVGMGKSTTAAMLHRLRVPVYDADAAVHMLLAPGGGAVRAVLQEFPGVSDGEGGIDRRRLGAAVFGDPAALRRLEAILHPMVRARNKRFRQAVARRRGRILILDVPLLFETGGERNCDAVIVVTAPAFLQRQRVLSRPGIDAARLDEILRQQMPDAEKRRRANFVVRTGIGRRPALARLIRILAALRHGLDSVPCRRLCSRSPRTRFGGSS